MTIQERPHDSPLHKGEGQGGVLPQILVQMPCEFNCKEKFLKVFSPFQDKTGGSAV